MKGIPMSEMSVLPCPLCGGQNLEQHEGSEGEESTIECIECNLILGLNTRRGLDACVAAWNRRAKESPNG